MFSIHLLTFFLSTGCDWTSTSNKCSAFVLIFELKHSLRNGCLVKKKYQLVFFSRKFLHSCAIQ